MAEDPKPDGAPAPPPAEEPKKPAAPAAAAKPHPPAAKAPAVMATSPWEGDLPDSVREEFGGHVQCLSYLDQRFFVCAPDAAVPILQFLKTGHGFDYLVDITAVHWPERAEQFDLIYIVYSFARNERIRIKASMKEGHKPETAVPVHLTADWLEREVFDMFGVEFEGHPGLKRILLPDEWRGHPLRKDYGILQMDNRWVQENLGIESGQ